MQDVKRVQELAEAATTSARRSTSSPWPATRRGATMLKQMIEIIAADIAGYDRGRTAHRLADRTGAHRFLFRR